MGWFNHQPNSRLGLWDDAWWIGSSWWWCAGGFANFRQVKGGKKVRYIISGQIIATSYGGFVRKMGPRKFQGNLGW